MHATHDVRKTRGMTAPHVRADGSRLARSERTVDARITANTVEQLMRQCILAGNPDIALRTIDPMVRTRTNEQVLLVRFECVETFRAVCTG